MAEESNSGAAEIAELLKGYVSRSEYDEALEAVNGLTTDRDTHKTAAEKSALRVAELEKTVRGRTYRDKFKELAKEAKLKDEMHDDAYKLLGIPEDSDEPDEKKMAAALKDFVKERKHYLAEDEPRKKTIPAGEGNTRGRSTSPGDPEFHVSPKDLNNASWMLLNQGKMREADMAGLLVLDDD